MLVSARRQRQRLQAYDAHRQRSYQYSYAWMTNWQRVLWTKQRYPDNYIPESFLSSLERNRKYIRTESSRMFNTCFHNSELRAVYISSFSAVCVCCLTTYFVCIHISEYFRASIRQNLGSTYHRLGINMYVPRRVHGLGCAGIHDVWYLDKWRTK